MTGRRWPGYEHPRWDIRPNYRRKEFDLEGVAGKVIVRDGATVGVCRIRFSERFAEDLGHRMLYGVSSTFPIFLRLTRRMEGLAWFVSASYFHLPSRETDLWTVGEQMPEWAKVKWHDFSEEKASPEEEWHLGSHILKQNPGKGRNRKTKKRPA